MQNKWIRLVRGCLVIRLGGDYMERFFNMCRMHDIDLWDIKRENDICMCEAYASDFLKMHPLLKKTGTKASVVKKRGLPFYFPFIKKRIIFFAGVFICLTMLNYVTDYVWAIEYVGNLQVSDDELSDFLEQESIHYGMKKSSINCEDKEKKLRETFQNVTWTSIYFEGTKLYIEIKENEKSEPVSAETKGTDIVANEAGTITSIVTRNGVPKVKAGDAVEKGQILVGGGVPVYDESQSIIDYQIYDADADIYIRTPVTYQFAVKSSYPVINYTNNNVKMAFAEVCGYHIDGMFLYDLWKGTGEHLYETITEKHQVVLLDNIYLPVYYGKINRKEYYIKYLTYTEDEMKLILSDNFEKFISGLQEKGIQIVEKNVKMVQNRSGMELYGDLLVIKPTGETAEITTNHIDEE
ncbi:MAG: sporulation protein YqfD [Lachnospiraceae bacterium]|nr:sporulation protein YqfD [Lachnospiraceae bacterium]